MSDDNGGKVIVLWSETRMAITSEELKRQMDLARLQSHWAMENAEDGEQRRGPIYEPGWRPVARAHFVLWVAIAALSFVVGMLLRAVTQ